MTKLFSIRERFLTAALAALIALLYIAGRLSGWDAAVLAILALFFALACIAGSPRFPGRTAFAPDRKSES